jgi:ribonuclease E
MVKRMLVDASHAEETRVVVANGTRLEEFDFESAARKQLKGNIYLAKVMRVEPSLQAAFVDYGGNRHGFLPFSEIHPDYYQIPVADREALFREQEEAPEPDDVEDDAQDADAGVEPDALSDETGDGDEDTGETAVEGSDEEPDESLESAPEAEPVPDDPSETDDEPEAVEASDEIGDDAAAPQKESHQESEDEATPVVEAKSIGDDEAAVSDDKPSTGDDEASAEADASSEGDPDAEIAADADSNDSPKTVAAAAPAPSISTEPKSGSSRRRKRKTSSEEGVEEIGGDEIEDIERRRSSISRSLLSRRYRIQEVIKKRQIILIQVVKEERGNKGAALTSYLSLAGRYSVLMPNAVRGGGISRKITSQEDRKRLKSILTELQVPSRMGVIVRTAGTSRSKAEIRRDFEYLMRQWEKIRAQTLSSIAPNLIYEEGNLIKRSIRDLYTSDVDEILVEGDEGYRIAKDFMRMLIPSHTAKVQPYRDRIPLFARYQIESQLDLMYSPDVQLKSGGYLVINSTEALVAIDVNSGRSTRERNIEETAVNTNLEAAAEVARQLRLRDLAGLIVIDFIDMDDNRNQRAVERKMKEAMRLDRARIQIGRISPFGLLEMSRQRLRPSLMEASMEVCSSCSGAGVVRSIGSSAVHALRAVEEEGLRGRSAEIRVHLPTQVAYYLLNNKRKELAEIEERCRFEVDFASDDALVPPMYNIERIRAREDGEAIEPPEPIPDIDNGPTPDNVDNEGGGERKKRRRRRRGRRDDNGDAAGGRQTVQNDAESGEPADTAAEPAGADPDTAETTEDGDAPAPRKRRRRGKRGGRRRSAKRTTENGETESNGDGASAEGSGDDNGDASSASTQNEGGDPTVTTQVDGSTTTDAGVDSANQTTSDAAADDTGDTEKPPAKPRRRRTRSRSRKKPEADASAELGDANGDAVPTAATDATTDATEEPVAAAVKAPVEVPVETPENVAPEVATEVVPAAAPAEAVEAPARPARRGWWQRKSAEKKEAD